MFLIYRARRVTLLTAEDPVFSGVFYKGKTQYGF